jgi:osmotically-inducible protein OsmY
MNSPSMRFPSGEWTLAEEDELLQRVVVRLQDRLGRQVRNFQMSGRGEGLVLRGQVNSYYSKQLTQEIVMDVSGLGIVANEIEVQGIELADRGPSKAK